VPLALTLSLLVTVLLDSTIATAHAHDTHPEVTVPRFESSPKIDGFLKEKCWEDAERIGGFTESEPTEGTKPEVETEVLLGYDDDNLYIAFICHENNISEIRSTALKRDAFDDNDDWIWITLDTYDTSKRGFVFAVNPRGVQADWHLDELAEIFDFTVDLEWDAAAKILDDRWTVEIAIPFKSLRFPSASREHWRIDFFRVRPRERWEFHAWVSRSEDDLIFPNLGHLYINERLLTNKRLDFLPYLTVGADEAADEERSVTSRVGLSGKYWITPDFIFDWAMRPDYSQIESDQPQINVNTTFALYYPEKRPLFLERKELFETPIQAIYTRTINDPIATLKLSGRLRKMDMGYIIAWDQHTPWIVPFAQQSFPVSSDRHSLSNILRVRYELPGESFIGLLGTGREIENSFSRVIGGDGRIKLLKNYYLGFQGLLSWNKEPDDTTLFQGYPWITFGEHTSAFDGEEFTGKAFTASLSRKGGRYVDFDLWSKGYSPEFRADNGYVSSNDLRDHGVRANLKFAPYRFMIEQFNPGMSFRKIQGYDGGNRETSLTSSLTAVLRRQNHIIFEHTWSTKTFQDSRFERMWTIQGSWFSNTFGFFSSHVLYKYGREINYFAFPPELGYSSLAALSLDFSPLPGLGLKLSHTRYLLWEKSMENKIHDSMTFSNDITYSFPWHFTSRLNAQYSSDTKSIELSPLLSFEPTPFTVFYLGSNHSLEKTGSLLDARESERRIFMKLQYLLGT